MSVLVLLLTFLAWAYVVVPMLTRAGLRTYVRVTTWAVVVRDEDDAC